MDSSASFLLFIIFICLVLSAFFSASETSLISLNRYKLRTAVEQHRYGAASAEKLLQQPERLITMILICNNVVNIGASALTTIVAESLFGQLGIAIATGLLTFIILLFSEIVPKTIASKFPERVAYILAPILMVVYKLSIPFVYIFNLLTKFIFLILRIENASQTSSLSSDELRVIVKEAQQLVGKEHSDMLNSILDLEEVTVEDIMVPRHEIASIDIDDDFESILRQINHATTSHLVVYRESLDRIVGILRIKEAYRLMMERNDFSRETMVRAIDSPVYIPEGTTLTSQLFAFKKNKRKLGLIVDEYGDIIGLITIDDILEEIVGNFTINSAIDEEEDINFLTTGKYLISGQANLRDLNKKFGWHLESDDARTLNGYLLEIFQDMPKVNTTYTENHLQFTIKQVSRTGIVEVEVVDTKRYKPGNDKRNKGSAKAVHSNPSINYEELADSTPKSESKPTNENTKKS